MLWDDVLDRVHQELARARRPTRHTGVSAQTAVAEAVARAHSHLLVSLDPRPNDATDTVSELVRDTAALLQMTLAVSSARGGDAELGGALVTAGEEDGEEAGDGAQACRDEEAGQHEVLGDGQEPLVQRLPAGRGARGRSGAATCAARCRRPRWTA